MTIERVNCPICNQDNTELLFSKGDLNQEVSNVICKNCALVYVNPRPSFSEFLAWQGDSFKASGHHSRVNVSIVTEKIKEMNDQIKNGVAKFLSKFIESNFKILDIGCGFGTLLHLLKKNHPTITVDGIELNKNDVLVAKKLFGLDLFYGTLEQFFGEKKEARYDLIILHHTFEHLADPLTELARIRDLLAHEGLLYIAVPNILNMKKRPELFFQLGHAFSYSPASLKKILDKAGFKIIQFNWAADYPGGMELLAQEYGSAKAESANLDLSRGQDPQAIMAYVANKKREFQVWRKFRDVLLFFVPSKWRITLGRFFYLLLKKL